MSCPICVAGPWGSEAEKECENRLHHPSGLHQAAPLSDPGPHLRGAAAGLQSPVQFLSEEHSVPGVYSHHQHPQFKFNSLTFLKLYP